MAKVSIIIPNWNGEGYLKECLESLMKIDYDNYFVIIVDNGSIDNSIQMIRKNFGDVFIIENKKNLGFSAACNIGIKKAMLGGTEYVLLLNNDTVVKPDFLSKMVQVAKDEDKVGIVGCKIYYFNDPTKLWFAGGDFIRWRMSGKHRYWAQKDNKSISGIHDSGFVTGCCMLFRKEVFKTEGYFYEPYFLGVEDLDFCYRAHKAGWKIKVNLDARIYHKVSLSREGEFSFSNGYYGTRNRLYFAFKRTRNYLAVFVLLFIIVPIRLLQWNIRGDREMAKGALFGVLDFIKNRMGERLT